MHRHEQKRDKTTHLGPLAALVLALAVGATACGSGGTDDTATADVGEATSSLEESAEESIADRSGASGRDAAAGGAPAPAVGEALTATTTMAAADDAAAKGGMAALGATDAEGGDTERGDNTFRHYGIRPFVATADDPLSTFALDVDTASYGVARRWVAGGMVPPADSVRVEEYVNSFDYDYPAPRDGLAVVADGGPSPYDDGNVIVRVGVQAAEVADADRPDASLTFVVDTSGSMGRDGRLELIKTALRRLVVELGPRDTVAIVTYGDEAQTLLPPTSVADEAVILDAVDSFRTDGSTNLEGGLQRGYDLAAESFVDDGINRVVLASDGVANVGLVDPDGLVSLIRGDADRGVQLITIGVGMGNYNDVTMERLANDGDGFYAYIDDGAEAERLFSDELVSTLLTVALDAKIQVEFDADHVTRYRLLGFENRAVLDSEFRNDDIDAGELGAGDQVTALYELTLASGTGDRDRLGTVQLRWEDPTRSEVRESRLELTGAVITPRWADSDHDFRLAVTAASLAEVLRQSPHAGDLSLDRIESEANALAPAGGAAAELARLVGDLRLLS